MNAFANALDKKAAQLYSSEEWSSGKNRYEKYGIDSGFYDMQCTTFQAVFDEHPQLFNGFQWIDSEDGMPLWVRPGVNWTPDNHAEE